MAIQKRTQSIPSPDTVKQSTQSFSEQELNELKELRIKINNLTLQFGQISISITKLKSSIYKNIFDLYIIKLFQSYIFWNKI